MFYFELLLPLIPRGQITLFGPKEKDFMENVRLFELLYKGRTTSSGWRFSSMKPLVVFLRSVLKIPLRTSAYSQKQAVGLINPSGAQISCLCSPTMLTTWHMGRNAHTNKNSLDLKKILVIVFKCKNVLPYVCAHHFSQGQELTSLLVFFNSRRALCQE